MSQEPLPIAAANTQCSSCGTAFHCGFRAGSASCWCSKLPRMVPVPEDAGTSCLCETCLRTELARRAAAPGSPDDANASHP